jgi:hypothetical protein
VEACDRGTESDVVGESTQGRGWAWCPRTMSENGRHGIGEQGGELLQQ